MRPEQRRSAVAAGRLGAAVAGGFRGGGVGVVAGRVHRHRSLARLRWQPAGIRATAATPAPHATRRAIAPLPR